MSNHQSANFSRNRQIYELWMSIQDIIGAAYLWPINIRRLFWIGNLSHFQRIVVFTFVYVNGVNPEIFKEWVELLNLARNSEAIRHFNTLFHLFDSGGNYQLYAYNVSISKWLSTVDGNKVCIKINKHLNFRWEYLYMGKNKELYIHRINLISFNKNVDLVLDLRAI